MNVPNMIKSPDWLKACTLRERADGLFRPRLGNSGFDRDRANRRLSRWRSQPPFDSEEYFAKRLALEGISEQEFLRILGETPFAIRERFNSPPEWLRQWQCAVSEEIPSGLMPASAAAHEPASSFLEAATPWISSARRRVREGICAISSSGSPLTLDPAPIETMLFANVHCRLMMVLSRTMVLELNIARLQGKLTGSTAGERFESFVQVLRRPGLAVGIFHEYPVLARQIITVLDQWVKFSLEFCRHLLLDLPAFASVLGAPPDTGAVTSIDCGLGDSHSEGKSVQIVTFASGWRVVYKPRSLSVDVHFQQLLDWCNRLGLEPGFRTLRHLDGGSHGWSEFAQAAPCVSEDEIKRFYRREGAYVALLYSLHATDFHFENVIAAGEFPMLIDLESLFQPPVEARGSERAGLAGGDAADFSVLRVGLLPQISVDEYSRERADLSGMATVAGQLTPRAVPVWEDPHSDTMRLLSRRVPLPEGRNRPYRAGMDINPSKYVGEVEDGFTAMYHLISEHQDELLARDGPLAKFEKDQVRVVVRPTMIYQALLWDSLHPDVLRDGLDRDRMLDRLWVGVRGRGWVTGLIPAERDDLMRGDIPLFTTRPGSHDLWTSLGRQISGVFEETGMHCAVKKIRGFGEQDFERQLHCVRSSLALLQTSAERGVRDLSGLMTAEQVSTEMLLREACSVADRLLATAYRAKCGASWIGLEWIGKKQWNLAPLGPTLYDGLAGVVLFLAYLGSHCGDPYTLLAEDALANLNRQIEGQTSASKSIGAFSGWGGILYLLTHLGVLWERPDLLNQATQIVEMLPPLIEQDHRFDVLDGAAGCLATLCTLYEETRDKRTLATAVEAGDRLSRAAERMRRGLAWKAGAARGVPLTGFAHGASGIAFALLRLAQHTGGSRFSEIAAGAIEYERSTFCTTEGNWPDLRDSAKGANPKYMTAWCHGAPGIGLTRLAALRQFDDPMLRDEIEVAVATTIESGFGMGHSLCHGDLGNLDLVLEASRVLDDPSLQIGLRRWTAAVVHDIRKSGWACGTPNSIEAPGLLTGLSGIGYQLLRLAIPARIPSVLTLQGPRRVFEPTAAQLCQPTEARKQ